MPACVYQVVTIVDTRPPGARGSDSRRRASSGAGTGNAKAGGAGVTLGSVGEPQDLAQFLANAAGWEGPKASKRSLSLSDLIDRRKY